MDPMVRIVDGLGGADFLRHRLSTEVVTCRVDAELAERICTWADLAEAVVSRRLSWPELRVFRNGVRVPEENYTTPAVTRRHVAYPRLNVDALQERLSTGATLSVGNVEEMLPGVRAAAETLSRLMHETVEVNAYASWDTESAFGPHWDHHDVVAVQVSGRKHWTVFGTGGRLPLPGDTDLDQECPDQVVWSGTLVAGDALHVPRGWWHDVTACDGPSLHLSFFFSRRTLSDYARFLVDRLRADDAMRADLARFDDTRRAAQQATVRRLLADYADRWSVEDFLAADDDAAPAFSRLSLPWKVQWPDGATPAQVVLRLRSARLDRSSEQPALVGAGKRVPLTAAASDIVAVLLDTPMLSYRELGRRCELDGERLLEAVRVLAMEGVIGVA